MSLFVHGRVFQLRVLFNACKARARQVLPRLVLLANITLDN